MEKAQRKSNFSIAETAILTEFVKENKEKLFGKLSPTLTKKDKDDLWKDCADRISALGVEKRSAEDIRVKFKNLKGKSKESYQKLKNDRNKTGGGPAINISNAETDIHEMFGSTPSFDGLNGFTTTSLEEADSSKEGKINYNIGHFRLFAMSAIHQKILNNLLFVLM